MAQELCIINFKGYKNLKEAIRLAAFHTGHKNSSQFLLSIVGKNKAVFQHLTELNKKEQKKILVK